MKYIFLLYLFLFVSFQNEAQSVRVRNLLFNSYSQIVKLDFANGSPVIGYLNNTGFEAIAHAEDAYGNIMFYVVSSGVYDANSNLMAGSGVMLTNPSATEIDICPFPQNHNKYYVFYQANTCTSLYYTIVDMTLNGGLGGVTNVNTLVDANPVSEGLEIVKRGCLHSYWLLSYECNVGITKYLIDSSGVGPPIVIYPYPSPPFYDGRGALNYFNGRAGIAFAYTNTALCWNFDAITGAFSNPVVINYTGQTYLGFYGLVFSPDTSKVYLTAWYETSNDNLIQYDFNSGNINTFFLSSQVSAAPGQIDLARDGKFYIIMDGSSTIEIVINPDSLIPSFSSLVTASSLALGVSDHIKSDVYNSLVLTADTVCFGDTTSFSTLPAFCNSGIVRWNFSDPSSGLNNLSQGLNPTHQFTSPGNQLVQVIMTDTVVGIVDTFFIDAYVRSLPILNLGNDTNLCPGQTITLNAGGNPGYLYIWSNGDTTQIIQTTMSGTYWVQMNDGNCINSDSVEINILGITSVQLGNDTLICQGAGVTLNTGIPGASYLWNTGQTTQSIYVNASGEYSVITTLSGCSGTDTIQVMVLPVPSVNLGNDTIVCQGTMVTLDAGITATGYNWNTGQTTRDILTDTSGFYWVVVSSSVCTASDTVQVIVLLVPQPNLGNDTIICEDVILTLNAGVSGDAYHWSTNQTTTNIEVSLSGSYWVMVDSLICSASDTVRVTVIPLPSPDLGNDIHLCTGKTIKLDPGVQGALYRWSTNEITPAIEVSTGGIYWVLVTKLNCSASDTVLVTLSPLPAVNLGPDQILCHGKELILDAGNSGTHFLWNDGDQDQTKRVNSGGDYIVEVMNQLGCRNTDTVHIEFELCEVNIFVPNAFTPGLDINNIFKAVATNITGFQMLIFNRWGELIYSTTSLNQGWDGRYHNQDCQEGVYAVLISYNSFDNYNNIVTDTKVGSVTLIR